MRLSAAVDLDQVKTEALAAVDLAFLGRLSPSPHAAVYAEKAEHARRLLEAGTASRHLSAEAEIRGVTPAFLASTIIAMQEKATSAAMALDLERQKLKARVRSAASQHDVMAIVAEVQ